MKSEDLQQAFRDLLGEEAEVWSRAPGRVNIIGEHTDYNDGFVFPAAINREIRVLARRRGDSRVCCHSLDFSDSVEFDLNLLERSEERPWSNYLKGVLQQFQLRGCRVGGMDLLIQGDVPLGAGLSSSAALEVAIAEAVRLISGFELSQVDLALLCQAAERQFVGVQCGIMDQFVSALAEEGSALFLDCRDLSYSRISLGEGVGIVICDSRVQRSLGNSAYNERRAECEAAVRSLQSALEGVCALRDVTETQLQEQRDRLDPVVHRRARHVVTENNRVEEGMKLLEKGQLKAFGRLMFASHASLRDDYEVSCPELDLLVELAGDLRGVIGARMTGAGFGGCTVNLVESKEVESFGTALRAGYHSRTGRECSIYITRPAGGAESHRIGTA